MPTSEMKAVLNGDFLFGEASRSIAATFMGPAASDIESIFKVWNMAKDNAANGATHTLATEIAHLVASILPFANLWFARAALNCLFLCRLYDTVSPGWARRYEARVKKENNQTFWLRPSHAVR